MEPKLIKGLLGWAAIGDGFMVYAKTRKEALRRYEAAVASSDQPASTEDVHVDDVSEGVRLPSDNTAS